MITTPFFSIVMPLYNNDTEVERAIRSVLYQTFQNVEIIVINDGSTDNGAEIVEEFRDSRIRLIHQENQGVSAARNRGINEAKADLIAFLDADDEWKPDFLETIRRLRQTFPFCKVFGTRYFFCSLDGKKRLAIVRGLPDGFIEGVIANYFEVASRSDPPLWTSAVAVEREAITGIGGFPVGIASGEDLLTWARLSIQYDVAYCNEPKAYCWAPLSVSERPGRVPKIPDFVGNELKKLLDNNDSIRCIGLKRYISLWHQMRANIFIQLGEGRKAREELRMAADYAGWGLKLYIFSAISRMPGDLSVRAFQYFRSLKNIIHYHEKIHRLLH